jgi:integrase
MSNVTKNHGKILYYRSRSTPDQTPRKVGINKNKDGSVRKVNGKVYVDFVYLGERVRESAKLPWTDSNAKNVRTQLNKIIFAIQMGNFKFGDVFPHSRKIDFFTEKERQLRGGYLTPEQVMFNDYAHIWYNLLKDSGRVTERTLWGYKSYIQKYLIPFFGETSFSEFNKSTFDRFVSWAKRQQYRNKPISNETLNKIFVPLKMICKDAAIEYGWGSSYNPTFGFKRLPQSDSYEKVVPFSLAEQDQLIVHLPAHWQPYFLFAFSSGLRQGEQIAIQPGDIDWERHTLKIERAVTRDEYGRLMIGRTKNRHSRRTIKLLPVMYNALLAQKQIYDQFGKEYFFCTLDGGMISSDHLRKQVWIPALKKAKLPYRQMKQTRHSFATNTLGCGENPLWIAKVMGHRDTDMIIRVYGKYIENAGTHQDGIKFNGLYTGIDRPISKIG